MTASKKPGVSWLKIKKEYLSGKKPSELAQDYPVTARQITQYATENGWTQTKKELEKQVVEDLREEIKQLKSRVLEEYQYLAFSNMGVFANWDGSKVTLTSSEQLDESAMRCVSELSETINANGSSVKFKLHDKKGALDSLAKILGMMKDADLGDRPSNADREDLSGCSDQELNQIYNDIVRG